MSFKKVSNLISNTPLLIFLLIIMGIYLMGLISQQHILIRSIELNKNDETRYKNEIVALKKEIASQNEFFIPDEKNNCFKIPYNTDFLVISVTSKKDWCNARFNILYDTGEQGFDIWFPSSYIAEMRGATGTNFYIVNNESPVYSIQVADAQNKTVNQYDTILTSYEQFTEKLIVDPVISKKIIEVHDELVLFVTTKDTVGRTLEHYIFDNGRTKDKKVYRVTFYKQLAETDKDIILNSFAPRFK